MIPHVQKKTLITAAHQNLLIDQVNQNTEDIANLSAGGGLPADEVQELIDTALDDHINAVEPHAAYDINMPSLKIIFENGLA